jgi:hypothetical protein
LAALYHRLVKIAQRIEFMGRIGIGGFAWPFSRGTILAGHKKRHKSRYSAQIIESKTVIYGIKAYLGAPGA